ncbi:molybdopterin-dependent oxidoreductase [Magnetovibrio sp.]|uniref:molybdopterin-dependent oxidoreductase n=1 Tax=Magnetovibrio sp. TaxID=2024836 RepID=UPI002F939647
MKIAISAIRNCAVTLLSVLFLMSAPYAQAEDLAQPTGQILLTVDGNVANANRGDGKAAVFDRAQLEALGLHTLVTSNPFIEGVHTFEGPLLADVLGQAGAKGEVIQARALDGYNVDIPYAIVQKYPVVLAMKMDGKAMRVRSKGPLWIILPVDQHEDLKAESYSGYSIWQLTTLTVK